MFGEGCLPLALVEVTSLIFPSPDLTSSLFLANSLMVIRTFEEGLGFPCHILVLFLVLKYKEPCLGYLLLGLIGVPSVANVATTSCSVFSDESIICFPCPFFL